MEENEHNPNNTIPKNKSFLNKIWTAIKKNPFSSFLLIVLILFTSWSFIKMNLDKKQYENDKKELITKYDSTIDSLKIKSNEFSAKVFSWSVRSELIRENIENLNQLCTIYVKESNATLIQLVDLKNNKIVISTDKQFEGNTFVATENKNFSQQFTQTSDTKTTIYTPIMGFNSEIGILIVEISK